MSQSLLRRARAQISNPDHWTKGTRYRNRYGDHSSKHHAHSCCIIGALQIDCPPQDEFSGAVRAIKRALDERGVRTDHSLAIANFNDSANTKHSDVLQVLDRAIELATTHSGKEPPNAF